MDDPIFNFEKRRIWVFGGAGYLGSAITTALDRAGANVICLDRPGVAAPLVLERDLRNTRAEDCDLLDVNTIPDLVADLCGKYGVPHGVVNLVTDCSRGKAFEEITAADFRIANDGVLTSGFLLTRAAAQAMKSQDIQGSFVHFSSMYGVVSPDPSSYAAPHVPNPIDYGAVKAGLLQMSRYFAVYFATDGIRSNCVTPGPFPHPDYQSSSTATSEALRNKVPMKRFGEAHEIVGPVLFLLSDAASYVTGQSIGVDGGWTAW